MARLDERLGRVLIPLVTPFKEDQSVDYVRLGELAEMVIERGYCDTIIVGGTTGEFISLSFEERGRLLEVVKEAVGTRVPLVAGTGAAYTGHAIELTRKAEALGYDTAMVVAPYYLKPTQEGIYRHFKAVAESTRLPVMLYNIPLFTGTNIDPETLERLTAIPNVVAAKEEAGVNPIQAMEFYLRAPESFALYCGDDMMVLQMLAQGGVGVVSGGSMVIGDRMQRMIDLFMQGDSLGASKISQQLHPFFAALNQNGRINPIPLLREAIGMTWKDVGAPRLPLLPGTEDERRRLQAVLSGMNVATAAHV